MSEMRERMLAKKRQEQADPAEDFVQPSKPPQHAVAHTRIDAIEPISDSTQSTAKSLKQRSLSKNRAFNLSVAPEIVEKTEDLRRALRRNGVRTGQSEASHIISALVRHATPELICQLIPPSESPS